MIRRARVASRGVHVVLDHELARSKAFRFVRVQSRCVSIPMRADQQVAARPDDPGQLTDPRHLKLLSEVGKHRKGIDEVECFVAIRERGRQVIGAYICEGKVLTAPLSQLWTVVSSEHANSRKVMPMSEHTTAPAAKIQDRLEAIECDPSPLHRRTDGIGGTSAPLEKPRDAGRPRDEEK